MKKFETAKHLSDSGLVSSSQSGVHPRLEVGVERHLKRPWTQPFHQPSVKAYRLLQEQCSLAADQPFILDSGCGTGKSTQQLARKFPAHTVVGIDRSQARLAKSGVTGDLKRIENCVLLRAELSTFWRLLLHAGQIPERHYLLYPNPWPKSGQLFRRWHGHPVFPCLLALGGEIEMRSNWGIYAQEFACAVNVASGMNVESRKFLPEICISPFEKKYLERGQQLYSVVVSAQGTEAFRRDWQAG